MTKKVTVENITIERSTSDLGTFVTFSNDEYGDGLNVISIEDDLINALIALGVVKR